MEIFTGAEAADAVLRDFDHFRNRVRPMASAVAGDDPIRLVVVDLLDMFGDLEDAVLARFGQPSRKGPPRPELAAER